MKYTGVAIIGQKIKEIYGRLLRPFFIFVFCIYAEKYAKIIEELIITCRIIRHFNI